MFMIEENIEENISILNINHGSFMVRIYLYKFVTGGYLWYKSNPYDSHQIPP